MGKFKRLIVFSLLVVMASLYMNCSASVKFNGNGFSTSSSDSGPDQGGQPLPGMAENLVFSVRAICREDGRSASAIRVKRPTSSSLPMEYYLIRDNCVDLSSEVAIPSSDITWGTSTTEFTYKSQVYVDTTKASAGPPSGTFDGKLLYISQDVGVCGDGAAAYSMLVVYAAGVPVEFQSIRENCVDITPTSVSTTFITWFTPGVSFRFNDGVGLKVDYLLLSP